MDLHVTLASARPGPAAAREIVIDTAELPTGAAIADRLEAAGTPGPFTVDGAPLGPLVPHRGALANGAVIVSGLRPDTETPLRLPHLVFVVRTGPDAGQVVPLSRGTYTIGRAGSDIVIADPALSRKHAVLIVTEDAILLEDLNSVNGTVVDGRPVTTASITVSSTLRFGSSRCRIELLDDPGWTGAENPDLSEPLPVGLDVPVPPSRLLIVTAFLPLVLGVVLALTTGMWFFLAFSALSAVTGTVPLLTYRRTSKAFAMAAAAAADRDARRRRDAVPDPGQTALDALRCTQSARAHRGRRAGRAPGVALLRLGTADQSAHLTVGRNQESFIPPTLPSIPVIFPGMLPARPGAAQRLVISGEASRVQALVRALLLQLAHPEADPLPVACWGSAHQLPLQARFLPHVHLTADASTLLSLVREGVRLIFQFDDAMPDLGASEDVVVVRVMAGHQPGDEGPGASMVITADSAHARIDGQVHDVTVDRVSVQSFERTARILGRVARVAEGEAASGAVPAPRPRLAVPLTASLWDGVPPAAVRESVGTAWASANAERPTARIGRSATGTITLDLVRDGPHFLVAGTTGSGKSELLRTLVLGLALTQPPEHLTFLLIDYKGGSGLGVLASLPHCVGSLTDLSSESTERALTSLRAELRHREQLCADHQAQDLDDLRRISAASCPPRLVVVIDEFRMLSDDVPTAVPDLMKIAALGRSLGVHLVLATQRAQGAVTPDMRANITSAILLRVQTGMESQDLLGSAAAAEISISTPGRAYLRRGAETPMAFQVASSSERPCSRDSPGWKDLADHLRGSAPARNRPGDDRSGHGSSPGGLLRAAVQGLALAAADAGMPAPRRPVLQPLPTSLTSAACSELAPADPHPPASYAGAASAILGILDYPDRQEQRSLLWQPERHSHLAFVGLPGSGASEALGTAVDSIVASNAEVHVYLLDGDGSLGDRSGLPQVGAYVRPHETRRAGRVLERLANLPSAIEGESPRIVLGITGWGRWTAQFRGGRFARAEEDLLAIARDGAQSGVAVLLAGDRELTASRAFALLPNRIYLPLGAHQETTISWPRMPSLTAVSGRGFGQGRMTGACGDGVCQLILDSTAQPLHAPSRKPFPVLALPSSVPLESVAVQSRPLGSVPLGSVPLESVPIQDSGGSDGVPEPLRGGLLLGVHGDDLRPFSLRLRSGEVYPVLGPPASGRSNALRVLAWSARTTSALTVISAPQGSRDAGSSFWRRVGGDPGKLSPMDRCVLLVDDADQLPADVQQILAQLVSLGAAAVLAMQAGPTLITRVPLSLQARGAGLGLVLMARSPSDADFLGVRLDVDGPAVPGRGFACEASNAVEVQVAVAPEGCWAGADPSPPGRPTASFGSPWFAR